MKQKTIYQEKKQKLPDPSTTSVNMKFEKEAKNFAPVSDEVARRAYFTYENEGSKPGRDVQHWLKAEADLIDERNLTRVHGFHNKT